MNRIDRRLTYKSRPYRKNKDFILPNGKIIEGKGLNICDVFDVGMMSMLRLNDDEYDAFLEALEDAGLENDLPLDKLTYKDKRTIITLLKEYGP